MTTAFLLTAAAGAATAVGGLLAVHRRVRCDGGLAAALAFAAGAMVLVSVVEILPKGVAALAPGAGTAGALLATLGLTAAGAGLVVVVRRRVLLRSGTVVALAVSAHNAPEGLVTFLTALEAPTAGAAVAVAVALHNVPEGVAVAAPVYGATGSRRRAVAAAGLSGLAEPAGAVLGYLLLAALLPPTLFDPVYGLLFGLVAGVMLHVSLVELVPGAWRLAPTRVTAVAGLAGGGVMVSSLVLLGLG